MSISKHAESILNSLLQKGERGVGINRMDFLQFNRNFHIVYPNESYQTFGVLLLVLSSSITTRVDGKTDSVK